MPRDHEKSVEDDTGAEYAQRRIDEQERVVDKLKAEGEDTRAAERLLAIYRDLLAALKQTDGPE